MKFNEQWLREWVNPEIDTDALAHQLTMAGLEVDAVEPVAPPFSGVVVGHVVSVAPHPNADRLRVCRVDVGEGEPLEIVCGAPNVAEGQKVPTARIGAVLPGDFRIKKSKLRGVVSYGMLCSAVELGLATEAEGLMILPGDAEPGIDVRDYLKLDDVTIEIGLTPNRGDCLSIQGIAREVAVANGLPLDEPEIVNVAVSHQEKRSVTLADPAACPRYIGRVIKGVDPRAETPLWMRERLRRCGINTINPVVDVTNYVMLELGQPMHAFDLDKLAGGIHVRRAENGEKLTLLDGREVSLSDDTLVIADDEKAVALAGIMGGEATAVSDGTRDIFLESAHFSRAALAGRARRHGLHTDSSYRFERGVDFELPVKAMKRATALLLEIAGGEAGPLIEANSPERMPVREEITLRADTLTRLLGIEVAPARVTEMLCRLGMKVCQQGREWIVTPPSFRFDIAIEADLVEEVGRIHGYDAIDAARPVAALHADLPPERVVASRRIRQALIDRGYQEVITYSFVDPALQNLLLPGVEAVALANPLSSELSVMRASLWPGLLQSLLHNQKRQQERMRCFEIGVEFLPDGERVEERKVVAGLVCGPVHPVQWGEPVRPADFFDLKGDVEALLALTGERFRFEAAEHSALHPGQSAAVLDARGEQVGWIGTLHPSAARQAGVAGTALLFVLDYALFERGRLPRFEPLSRFPRVKRDLAVVVDEAVTAGQIRQVIEEAGGETLTQIDLFDLYRGEGIDPGRKSVALGLTFQNTSRTLTDQEIDALMSTILERLTKKLNATLRE